MKNKIKTKTFKIRKFKSKTLPVRIEAASILLKVADGPHPTGVPISGRLYEAYAVDKLGNEEFIKGLKSFKFEVTANGYGTVKMELVDRA